MRFTRRAAAIGCGLLAASVLPIEAEAAQQGANDPAADNGDQAAAGNAPEAEQTRGSVTPRPLRRPAGEKREERWGGPMTQLLWFDAQGGVEAVELTTFVADFDTVGAGFLPTSGVGPTIRAGGGVRLGFLTLGARGRVATFDDRATVGAWQIWTLDGELGVRVPLYRVEPHVIFAGGYSSFGGYRSAVGGLSDGLDVHGVDGRLTLGVDYWVTHDLSLGGDLSGELLAIARPGVPVRDLVTAREIGTVDDAKARILEASGSSVGFAVAFTGGAALHF